MPKLINVIGLETIRLIKVFDMSNSELYAILISVVFGVAIFLVCRELFCWYFKINERVRLQERQVNLLVLLIKELKEANPANVDNLDNSIKEVIEQ